MKILTWIAIKEQLQNVMFLFNKNYYLKSFYLVILSTAKNKRYINTLLLFIIIILSSLTLLQVWMGGGGPHVGCRLKFHYFVGCRLKFVTFVGSR